MNFFKITRKPVLLFTAIINAFFSLRLGCHLAAVLIAKYKQIYNLFMLSIILLKIAPVISEVLVERIVSRRRRPIFRVSEG